MLVLMGQRMLSFFRLLGLPKPETEVYKQLPGTTDLLYPLADAHLQQWREEENKTIPVS